MDCNYDDSRIWLTVVSQTGINASQSPASTIFCVWDVGKNIFCVWDVGRNIFCACDVDRNNFWVRCRLEYLLCVRCRQEYLLCVRCRQEYLTNRWYFSDPFVLNQDATGYSKISVSVYKFHVTFNNAFIECQIFVYCGILHWIIRACNTGLPSCCNFWCNSW